jgi:hypothetical protein
MDSAISPFTSAEGSSLLERLENLELQMDSLEKIYSPRTLEEPHSPLSMIGSPRTPSSLERRCRSARTVLAEAEVKGTLVQRVQSLEERLMRVCMYAATLSLSLSLSRLMFCCWFFRLSFEEPSFFTCVLFEV